MYLKLIWGSELLNFYQHLAQLEGFDYPDLTNKNDTDIFSYPIKSLLAKRDAFVHSFYRPHYFKNFNEVKLSFWKNLLIMILYHLSM